MMNTRYRKNKVNSYTQDAVIKLVNNYTRKGAWFIDRIGDDPYGHIREELSHQFKVKMDDGDVCMRADKVASVINRVVRRLGWDGLAANGWSLYVSVDHIILGMDDKEIFFDMQYQTYPNNPTAPTDRPSDFYTVGIYEKETPVINSRAVDSRAIDNWWWDKWTQSILTHRTNSSATDVFYDRLTDIIDETGDADLFNLSRFFEPNGQPWTCPVDDMWGMGADSATYLPPFFFIDKDRVYLEYEQYRLEITNETFELWEKENHL